MPGPVHRQRAGHAAGGAYSEKFERFEAVFAGAGDTLSAALAALLAGGHDLQAATAEALPSWTTAWTRLSPGMGNVVPDRLFWAQPVDPSESDEERAMPMTTS
jgi:hydroxymethylpyrimidine/phosphomethylpyrimidine kinase